MAKIWSDEEARVPKPGITILPSIFYLSRNQEGKPYNLPVIGLDTLCSWRKRGGCTFCNFGGLRYPFSEKIFLSQLKNGLYITRGSPYLHIAVDGSTFDDEEVPATTRLKFFKIIKTIGYVKTLETESKAEFITDAKIEEACKILRSIKFGIGIGLESSDDFVREHCINKGLTKKVYINAIKTLRRYNVFSQAHVILKPPFLTEYEAILDAEKSIRYALNTADEVIFFPINIKSWGCLTGWLHRYKKYSAPKLWSFLEVLGNLSDKELKRVFLAGFIGGPILQNASNCEKCTPTIMQLIENFNYTRNREFLKKAKDYKCSCKNEWKRELTKRLPPLKERIIKEYEFIAKKLLGEEWWSNNQVWVKADLQRYA
jgi:hypothetical protein